MSVLEPEIAARFPSGERLANNLIAYNDNAFDNTCVLAAFDAAIERLEASDAAA